MATPVLQGAWKDIAATAARCKKFDELYKKDATTSSSSKEPPPLPAPAEAPPTPRPSLARETPGEPSLEPVPHVPERDILYNIDEDEDNPYAPGTPAEDKLPAAITRGCQEANDDREKLSEIMWEKMPCEQFKRNSMGLVQWEPGDSTPFARRCVPKRTRLFVIYMV